MNNESRLFEHQVDVFMMPCHPEIGPDGDDRNTMGIGIPHLPGRPRIGISSIDDRDNDISILKCVKVPVENVPMCFFSAVVRIVTDFLGEIHFKEMG